MSEGVGYGMLLALYSNDQEYFDKIYNASKTYYLSACSGWRKPANGGNTESGSASDADEDIALALIFADKLQDKGMWGASSINYKNEAQSSVNCVWNTDIANGYLNLGGWGGPPYNIGYFAPAWYRIFKKFDSNVNRDWQSVVDNSYTLIEKCQEKYGNKGLVPDFSNAECNPQGTGYNVYGNSAYMFKDAIRTLWRISNDYIWFGEERAEAYLKNALNFIKSKDAATHGAIAANYYTMDGELVPADDKWTEFNDKNNPDTWRWRREHSHLTIGQWVTAVMAVGDSADKVEWQKEMAKFYDWDNKVDFFGIAYDPTAAMEDTLHNEMYFDQFLAWFGVSLMSGTWVNVYDLLDSPEANVKGIEIDPYPEVVPILNNPKFSVPNSQSPVYYTLQGKPMGQRKPSAPGVYIAKRGSVSNLEVVK